MSNAACARLLLFAGELFFAASPSWRWRGKRRRSRKRASLRHLVWAAAFGRCWRCRSWRLSCHRNSAWRYCRRPAVLASAGVKVSHAAIPFIAAGAAPSMASFDLATIAYGWLSLWLVGIAPLLLRRLAAPWSRLHAPQQCAACARGFDDLPILAALSDRVCRQPQRLWADHMGLHSPRHSSCRSTRNSGRGSACKRCCCMSSHISAAMIALTQFLSLIALRALLAQSAGLDRRAYVARRSRDRGRRCGDRIGHAAFVLRGRVVAARFRISFAPARWPACRCSWPRRRRWKRA